MYLVSYIRSHVVTNIVYHDVMIESQKQRTIVHTMHSLWHIVLPLPRTTYFKRLSDACVNNLSMFLIFINLMQYTWRKLLATNITMATPIDLDARVLWNSYILLYRLHMGAGINKSLFLVQEGGGGKSPCKDSVTWSIKCLYQYELEWASIGAMPWRKHMVMKATIVRLTKNI
jgi:hypothetical protein